MRARVSQNMRLILANVESREQLIKAVSGPAPANEGTARTTVEVSPGKAFEVHVVPSATAQQHPD